MNDTVFVKGAEKLARRIATIRRNAAFTLDAAVGDAGLLLLERNRERFRKGVNPDGVPWAPLAESTLQRKKYPLTKIENRNRILFRTDELYNSINLVKGRVPGIFAVNTGAGVRIGTGGFGGTLTKTVSEYARVLQQGVPGRMPARRFLGISAKDIKDVDNLLRRRLRQLVEATANG